MTLTLAVDGATRQLSLPATANWDSWSARTDAVTLSAGPHPLAYRFGSGDSGNVNLDAITVTPPGSPPPGGPLEAESAEPAGGAVPQSDHAGNGNSIEDSVLSDTVVASSGVAVSTRFGQPFSGPTSVLRTTLTRTGGYEVNWQKQLPALWIYADASDITMPVLVRDLTITASTYEAVWFSNIFGSGRRISGVELDHVAIDGAGTYGLQASNVAGSAAVSYVTVTGAASGGASLSPGFTLIRGEGNSGF